MMLDKPVSLKSSYAEKTYAGVLGKAIGVYLGRPVEGWSYEAIQKRFDEVDYFIHEEVNWPLIVPDDDLSGTFLFYRALEDNGFPKEISAKAIGDTWLNYIVEDKTVLWWGGLGRSTEHTAYLRLKNGIDAPRSGSTALNGRYVSEAIGSEIFIDTWALANPGDPDRAAAMARAAASVSHDGVAIEAAVLLAAMEARAFDEVNIDALLDTGTSYVQDEAFKKLLGELRDRCASANDWRSVRRWLGDEHSYDHYPGCCPMVPNHLLLLASFILGGDNFQHGLKIAVSSGWDTDCNAGNLGCLNGIRLGLAAIESGPDFRSAVSDLIYVVSADGGECMSDAVIETRRARRAAAALAGEDFVPPADRFAFEYKGSVQGFTACPLHAGRQGVTAVGNANSHGGPDGLEITFNALAKGVTGSVSVPTFIDPKPKALADTSYFEVVASPSVYGTQTIRATVLSEGDRHPTLRFIIHYYGPDGKLTSITGDPFYLKAGDNSIEWKIPDLGGLPIHRVAISLGSDERLSGSVVVKRLDWSGSPEAFRMGSAYELSPNISPFDLTSYWVRSFVSSAKHFGPDIMSTFCLSHPSTDGVATTGTRDWVDYSVESKLTLEMFKTVGLVARVRGHRRYYAAVLQDGFARIIKRLDRDAIVLAEVPFVHEQSQTYAFNFEVKGDRLTFSLDGKEVVSASDDAFPTGGAGYLIEEGTAPAMGFDVRGIFAS